MTTIVEDTASVFMMGEKAGISGAELEIMKVLWKQEGSINTQAINQAVAHKRWKRTTVSTFITRLVEKGFISSEKRGNCYFYTCLISKKEYRRIQTRNLIQSLYHGSVKELAYAFDAAPVLKDGTTYVPVQMLEMMQAESGLPEGFTAAQ